MKRKIALFLAVVLLVPALVLGATLIMSNKPLAKDSPETYFITGNAFYNNNDLDNAIKSYEKVVSLDPNHELAHSNLAFLYNKEGNFVEAAQHSERLVEINPANPTYHYDYAVNIVLNIKKSGSGSIEDIEKAISEFKTADDLAQGYAHAQENIQFLEGLRAQYYASKR
jgi:tetratricopeptide (TPR) repeat protein